MDFFSMNWVQLSQLDRRTPVVIPIAAVEQHGHHLPVSTDSLLLGEIVRRAGSTLGDSVLWLPLQWLGNSHHHLDFGGTLSAEPRVYLDLLRSLGNNLIDQGFQRVVWLNGHGGNHVPAQQALFELRQTHRARSDLLLLMGTYWELGAEPAQHIAGLHQHHMGHACEWETSMVLRLRPDWVGDYRKAPPVEPGEPFTPGFRAWTTKDRSAPGHVGWPDRASAEKGEALFECFTAAVVSWLQRAVAWDGRSWEG